MINIKDFCSQRPFDVSLHEPFNFYGKTFASDGIILVRVELDHQYDKNDVPHSIERLEQAINRYHSASHEYKPFPADEIYSEIPATVCPKCKGKNEPDVCPECHGDGKVEFETWHNVYICDCQTCHGTGQIECDCNNNKLRPLVFVAIGYKSFYQDMVNRLRELPDCKLWVHEDDDVISVITFEGGDGLIMHARYEVKKSKPGN